MIRAIYYSVSIAADPHALAHLEPRKEVLCLAIPPHRAKVDEHDGCPENGDSHRWCDGRIPESNEVCGRSLLVSGLAYLA